MVFKGKVPVVVAALVGIATSSAIFEPLLNPEKNKITVFPASPEDDKTTKSSTIPSSPSESDQKPLHTPLSSLPQNTTTTVSRDNNLNPIPSSPPDTGSSLPAVSASPASITSRSAIANAKTLTSLPSTEISKSAHPDDAAKIMDEPLPSSPLIAKKIPAKGDSTDMQAEPFTEKTGGGGWGIMKFW